MALGKPPNGGKAPKGAKAPKDTAPFSFRAGRGLLYTMPAGLKLVLLPALSASAFLPAPAFLPIFAAIILALALSSRIKPWQLLAGSKGLFTLALTIIAVKTARFNPPGINTQGLQEGLLLSGRMLLSFCLGALLFTTTTMGQIHTALSKVEAALGLKRARISLGIALMLGFIPAFFEIWNETDLAWKSRKGSGAARKMLVLIPLVLERLMEKAAVTAEAVEARGF